MSKSALKALANADAMIKTAGIMNAAPLVEYLNDGKGRTVNGKKLWRNADVLASLLICAAADCLQTETPDTLAENGFDDMAQAVDRYVASALDIWSQWEWMDCKKGATKPELDRLAEMVNGHLEYLKRAALKADDNESASICNLCASLIVNDDATGFDYSDDGEKREENARIGIASWRAEWLTLAVDLDNAENDISFGCECCGARVHGWRGRLIFANFRN